MKIEIVVNSRIYREHKKITEAFAKESLTNRYYENGYYLAQMRDELCIRADAYCKNPRKKHHLSYILEHKEDWDKGYAKSVMKGDKHVKRQIFK